MPTKPIPFIDNRPLKLSFTSKTMTAYGGFTLIAKLLERLGFRDAIEGMIPFHEVSPNATGVYAKVIRLGLTVLAGGFRFSHTMFLGDCLEIYEQVFGIAKIPKSISAVTRFFNRFRSWQGNEQFADKLWEYSFSTVVPLADIAHDVLTFDSSVLTRYGHQDGASLGYNPKKKGRPSHHPIMAFLNQSKYVVNLWNRSGNTASGNGAVEFAKQTLARLNGRLQIDGCLADSGFYDLKFLQYLEEQHVEYVIAAKFYSSLQQEIGRVTSWTRVDDGIEVGEMMFVHFAKSWTQSRRYIVVRQHIRETKNEAHGKQLRLFKDDELYQHYRYSAFVTSSQDEAVSIWRKYRLRAGDENIIKENKADFGLDGYSLKGFYATEAAMLLRMLFYNIINLFRSRILSQADASHRLHTIRAKYLIIPSVLGRDGKNPILRLGLRRLSARLKFKRILAQLDPINNNRFAFGVSVKE